MLSKSALSRPRGIIALALLLFAACREPVFEPPAVAVNVSVDAATVSVTRPISVRVVVSNTTGMPVHIPGGPFAFIEVRDEADHVVAFGRFGQETLPGYLPQTLAPGEAAVAAVEWAGERSDGAVPRGGIHSIRGVVPVSDSRGRWGNLYSLPVQVLLRTN